MRFPLWPLTSMLLLAAAAQAQLRLPGLPLPGLPLQSVTQTVTQIDSPGINTLRRTTVERLLRDHRKTIAADPDGNPIVRSEVLATGMSEQARESATQHGFVVMRVEQLGAVGVELVVLQAPSGLSTAKALRALREADPDGTYDYDHLYQSSGVAQTPPATTPASAITANSLTPTRIGLIDSGVDVTHPAFARTSIHTWGCDGAKLPDPHGTAVASLLVTHRPAQIFAADVYCNAATGGSIGEILAALDWLLEQRIAVINISLVGPKNRLLELVIASATARGYLLVAAVGNDGPASAPLYPAAYPGVVGVTAVDAHHRVLLEAVHGPQVMFAAQGADLKAASGQGGASAVRGTSFAAPEVAALAAQLLVIPDRQAAEHALASMIAQAVDLGPQGKDFTYGYGFLALPEENP